jgi:TPR repeat protein
MQAAVWLFEGLRAAGIRLQEENASALRDGGGNQGEGRRVEVQYPAETLGFRTGNRTDMGLLFAAALEAAGIPSAIIPLDGDFIVAYNLGASQAGAELLFNGLEKVLVIDGQVWMPLSMNAFNGGFAAAWDGGVEALNRIFAADAKADFIMPESAWGIYPPAPLPAQGATAVRVNEVNLAQAAGRIIEQYIAREIQPQVQNVQRQIAANPSAALYNRLAILLVRSGRTEEAKSAYERAAGMGLVPAMTNRGNLALIEQDYTTAERWFRQALAREPENAAALRSLEKVGERGE